MRKILSSNLLRQLTATELIIKNVEQSIEELSQQLTVSEKTIRKDIAVINSNIAPLEIKVRTTEECYLKWRDGYSLDYVYSCFLNASTDYQILEKILKEENLTYNELADAVFVSVSTLRRSLARMNEVLVDYDMEILSNPVRVRGDEKKIIGFLYAYLEKKHVISTHYLSQFESEIIDEVLVEILPYFNLTWNFTKSEMIKRLIKSHVVRLKNGNHIPVKSMAKQAEVASVLKKLDSHNKRLEKIFGVPFLAQIITQIIEDNYAFSDKELKKLERKDKAVAETTRAIRNIVSAVESQFVTHSSDLSELVLALYNRTVFSFSKFCVLNDPTEEFVNRLEKDRPAFVKVIKEQYVLNEKILGKHFFSGFTFYLVTEWRHLFRTPTSKKKMNIGLFFSTSNSHIDFLQAELERKLNRRVVLTNLNSYNVTMLGEVAVDLIITDISNLSFKQKSVSVSRYINDEDFIKIITAYSDWLNKN